MQKIQGVMMLQCGGELGVPRQMQTRETNTRFRRLITMLDMPPDIGIGGEQNQGADRHLGLLPSCG